MICQVLYTCNTHNNPARKVGSFTRQRLIEQLIEFFCPDETCILVEEVAKKLGK